MLAWQREYRSIHDRIIANSFFYVILSFSVGLTIIPEKKSGGFCVTRISIISTQTMTHFICFFGVKNFSLLKMSQQHYGCEKYFVLSSSNSKEKKRLDKQKHSRKKCDPADALTVAYVLVISLQLLLSLVSFFCFRESLRGGMKLFHPGEDDVFMIIFHI
jgi:hypothetical protein